jgi:hypothetical protein
MFCEFGCLRVGRQRCNSCDAVSLERATAFDMARLGRSPDEYVADSEPCASSATNQLDLRLECVMLQSCENFVSTYSADTLYVEKAHIAL